MSTPGKKKTSSVHSAPPVPTPPKPKPPTTTTSSGGAPTPAGPATWGSIDPRSGADVPYSDSDNIAIEKAYQSGAAAYDIVLGTMKFQIRFKEMIQTNASGGRRGVWRRGPLPPAPDLVPIPAAEVTKFMSCVEVVDTAMTRAIKEKSVVVTSMPAQGKELTKVFDHMIAMFAHPRFRAKYHASGDDDQLLTLPVGQKVPQYFANVKGQSMYQRKLLSMLGLRNLIQFGTEIFVEMQQVLFSGCLEDYEPKKGLHKFMYFTGNVVDLDTTVLRCTGQVLELINKANTKDGLDTFDSPDDFSASPQAKDMVMTAAEPLIRDFCEELKLNDAQKSRRRVDLDTSAEIPVASSNSERGHCPVWHYVNAGMNSFHVNVPTMSDVYGSILLAPVHACKAYLTLQVGSSEELTAALDGFYEDCIADTCFNQKWKAIEMFNASLSNVGTIDNILADLEKTHQSKFSPQVLADDTGVLETEVLLKLLPKGATGKDGAGVVRPISKEDVLLWVKKQLGQ